MVDVHIHDSRLTNMPIHANKHAYQVGMFAVFSQSRIRFQ